MGIVIGILGMAKSGKDEIGKTFIANKFKRYAFGDAPKKEYAEFIEAPEEEMHNEHKDFHRPGIIHYAEGKRAIDPYYWVDIVSWQIKREIKNGADIVITDMRRVPEIIYLQRLKKKYGNERVILIYVERPLINNGVFDEDPETEKAIMYAKFHNLIDINVLNASTKEELQILAQNLLEQEILK